MLISSAVSALAGVFGFQNVKSEHTGAHGKPQSFNSLDSILHATTAYTPPRNDAITLQKLYNDNPWVRSIVGRVGSLVARQEWYVADRAGNEIEDHPAIDFMMAGGPGLSGGQSLRLTCIHIDLAGEAFWAVGRGTDGKPASYAVIPPHECVDTPHVGKPTFEFRRANGVAFTLHENDVVWFRDPDPLDPYGRGRSLTGSAVTELATDEAASEHTLTHLKNRARPDYILSGTKEAPISAQDRAAVETTLMQKFGKNGNGKPFVSTNEIKITPFGATLKDTEMSTLRPELRAIITEIYGVPPEVFGRIDNSNRATIESANFLLALHTIEPRLWMLWEVLKPFIRREFKLKPKETLEYVSPVKEDDAFTLAVMQAQPTKFTGNEFRVLAGFEPMDGEDELPDDTDPEDPNEDGKQDGNPTDDLPAKALAKNSQQAHTDRAADLATSKQIAPSDVVDVSSAFEEPQVKATITALIDQLYTRLIERYGIGLLTMLEQDAVFNLNTAVANWLATEIPHLLDGVNATTREALKAALVTGVAQDELAKDLIERVDNVFAAAIDTRAGIISQTEATKLAGFSAQTSAEQAGFESKMWLTSGDQKVRSAHKTMDGQVKHITEPFAAPDGSTAMFPGGFGKASQDINCRCAMRPVLDTEEATKAFGPDFEMWHEHSLDAIAADIGKTFKHIFSMQKQMVLDTLKARAGT
jgi:phage portal protein BeeE